MSLGDCDAAGAIYLHYISILYGFIYIYIYVMICKHFHDMTQQATQHFCLGNRDHMHANTAAQAQKVGMILDV